MKQISILITGFVLCCSGLSTAQITTYTPVTNVKTPNNSTVPDTHSLTSTDISFTTIQFATLASEISANYNGAVLIEAPSYQYNCHAYAWHVSEGGNKVWIGRDPIIVTAEDVYWTDGSYIEVNENEATKVSYHENGNHSAIRLNSTWYQSKWGSAGVVKHHPNDVPSAYQPSMTKKYYKRTPPSISGPSTICSGSSGTFTISSNVPPSYTWNKSADLTLVSTSGNTATFSRSSSAIGTGWVSIVVNNAEVARKNVYSAPVITAITGPSSAPNGQYADFQAVLASGPSTPTNYQWILNPLMGTASMAPAVIRLQWRSIMQEVTRWCAGLITVAVGASTKPLA
jgi:hypothetical protein